MNNTSEKYKVSFVIPTGGQRDHSLKTLLQIISGFDLFEKEIIPIGNTESISASADIRPLYYPELAKDGEICRMRNIAAAQSSGDIIVFLDDDAEILQGWQENIISLLRLLISGAKDIGTCRIVGPNGKRWYDWNWGSRLDLKCPSMLLPYGLSNENLYISGCCMIMRRDVWHDVQFDENRLNHQHDDVSFCHKAHDLGKRFTIQKSSVIRHLLLPSGRNPDDPASGRGEFPDMIYLYRLGQIDQARSLLDTLKNDCDPAVFNYYKGLFSFIQNKFQDSFSYFQRAISFKPDRGLEAQALYRSALCALALKNKESVLDILSKTLELMPDHPFARFRLSRLKEKMNQVDNS